MYGPSEEMFIVRPGSTDTVFISGTWSYLPVAEYSGGKWYVLGSANEVYTTRPKQSMAFGPNSVGVLYRGMIAPLVPYAISGAIWYQGESNAGNPEQYKQLFPSMIRSWRHVFGQGDFPFYFVQIAPWAYAEWTKSGLLRDAQREALKLPQTGMAVTMDIGDSVTIHPADKKSVGERLALLALNKTYGKDIASEGPMPSKIWIHGNELSVKFLNADDRLVYHPSGDYTGFEIAGEDGKFVPAVVKVDGSTVVLSSKEVKNPVSVRYAFENLAIATIFNTEGLPAPSFIEGGKQ